MAPQRTKQLALFELLEPQDINYSNFVDFFDSIPKFVDASKRRYFDYQTVKPSMNTEFKYRASSEQAEKLFMVTLKPGRVKIKGEDKQDIDVLVYPTIQREEAVYDALRKLAQSGYGGFYEEELGTSFSLSMLQKELKKFGKTYSISELKESLRVLRSAEMHVVAIDGSFEWEPSYLSNMALTTRSQFLEGGNDAKCLVIFDNLVSTSINKLEFREFNYAIAQQTKNVVAKYLTKRMDKRFKQASQFTTYSIKLSTIFKDIFREMDSKMSNNTRLLNAAITELKKKLRIADANLDPIKSERDKRKTIDYLCTFTPHPELISDIKRFHAKQALVAHKSARMSEQQKL